MDPRPGLVRPVIEDHRRVVAVAEAGAQDRDDFAERLDREILPCLERPGRHLGPFDLQIGAPDGPSKLLLLWPSESEGPDAPSDLGRRLSRATPRTRSDIALVCLPPTDLQRALARADLSLFSRPHWNAVGEHPLWLAWIEHPLQILGLRSLLGVAVRDERPLPRIVAAGPCAWPMRHILSEWVDATVDLDLDECVAAALSMDPAGDVVATFGARSGARCLEGRPRRLGAAAPPPEEPVVRREEREPRTIRRAELGRPLLERRALRSEVVLDRLWVGAASETLRAELGLSDGARLEAAIVAALTPAAGQLELVFGWGLPGETDSDRAAIADFVEAVVARAPRGVKQVRARLQAYWPSADEREAGTLPARPQLDRARMDALRRGLRSRRLPLDLPPAGLAWFASLLEEQPDAGLVEELHAQGARSAESALATDDDLWEKCLRRAGRRPIGPVSSAPTDGASAPVAATGLVDRPTAIRVEAPGADAPAPVDSNDARWARWAPLVPRQFDHRVEFAKRGRMRWLGPGDLTELLLRACERAELPLATAGVVQPRPKLSFGPSLPVGIEGVREYFDLGLTRPVPDLAERLRPHLPGSLDLRESVAVPGRGQHFALSQVALVEYEFDLDARDFGTRGAWSASVDHWMDWKRRLDADQSCGDRPGDLLEQLRDVEIDAVSDTVLRVRFRLDLRGTGPKCKPRDVLERSLEGLRHDVRCLPLRRLRQLVLEEEGGRAHARTPLEQIRLAGHRLRARAERFDQ